MDFWKIKNSISDTFGKWSKKAIEVTSDTFAHSGVFYEENRDNYLDAITKKRMVIIAFDERSEYTDDIMLALPVWQTKAFLDVAKIMYLNHEKSQQIIDEFWYQFPIEMRVFMDGNEKFRLNDWKQIESWWKADSRNYEKVPENDKNFENSVHTFSPSNQNDEKNENLSEKNENPQKKEEVVDPLLGK